MNPALLVLVIAALSGSGGSSSPVSSLGGMLSPGYFDTFRMELLLDRLHSTVDALERINHLGQIAREPINRQNSAQKIRESMDTVKPFLPEEKSQQISNLTGAMDSLKQLGDMQGIMQMMGPMLKMLSASSDEDSKE